MKDIIIVCAGAFGREVYTTIEQINRENRREGKRDEYNILGFLDDNVHALEDSGIEVPVIGRISDWKPLGGEVYAIGAAFGDMKQRITDVLKNRGCHFETLLLPGSRVARDCRIGEGCYITAHSISSGVELGNFVNVNASILCPGTHIDDCSTTTAFAVVDNARIGKRVFIGSNAVIEPGVQIGDDARICAGSIVTEDVPAGATVFGVPAKRID